MEQSPSSRGRIIWIGLGLTFVLLLLAVAMTILRARSGAGATQPLPVIGPVGDFTLTNQNGAPVALADLRGNVWVADIIFTRCAGPCLRMSQRMKDLQHSLVSSDGTRLVSLTTDPDYDTPPVLKQYAARFGADSSRWFFLTGTKPHISALAIDSLKLTAIEKKPEERQDANDLFIHSTIFVIVDKLGRLRGVFETEGEGVDVERVKTTILEAIRRLEREA